MRISLVFLFLHLVPGSITFGQATGTKALLNGKDLSGWYTFLPSRGVNQDPDGVFTVKNGWLHITGKEFGYMGTEKSYDNFHLVAIFKWGTKKYPPREADTIKRDNGICFYFSEGLKDTVWPASIECQVQEGDVGDIWLIGHTTLEVDGKRTNPKPYERVVKSTYAELPHGSWNKVEIIANRGTITYVVNGVQVNQGKHPSVSSGKILIQSEGAEIFYREITIREL